MGCLCNGNGPFSFEMKRMFLMIILILENFLFVDT